MKSSPLAPGFSAAHAPYSTSQKRKVTFVCCCDLSLRLKNVVFCHFRGGWPKVSSLQPGEDHELVKEKGNNSNTATYMSGNVSGKCAAFFCFWNSSVEGGENGSSSEEEKHLCGRRSKIHNVYQSQVRVWRARRYLHFRSPLQSLWIFTSRWQYKLFKSCEIKTSICLMLFKSLSKKVDKNEGLFILYSFGTEDYLRYAHGLISEYISEELSKALLNHLG